MACNFIVTFATSNEDKANLYILYNVKYNELYRKLRRAGCSLLQHGGRHDKWVNPANGKETWIPRHGTEEIPKGTLNSIYRQLGLKPEFALHANVGKIARFAFDEKHNTLIYMAKKVIVIVETGKDLFSCFISKDSDEVGLGLHGTGKTVRAAIEDFYVCCDEEKTYLEEQGKAFPDVEFHFLFDVGAFFDYYPLSQTAFAKYIGMNSSLLRQYAAGIKTPQGKSLEKIREGIEKVKGDIDAGMLIDRPVLQYV